MARQDGRIEPGQPLSQAISARAWNRAMDAADYVMSGRGTFAEFAAVNQWPVQTVLAKNLTGSDLEQFRAVELMDRLATLNGDPSAKVGYAKSGHVVNAITPNSRRPWLNAESSSNGMVMEGGFYGYPPPPRWGIAVEPIPNLKVGRIAVSGVVLTYLTRGPGIEYQQVIGTNSPDTGAGFGNVMFPWIAEHDSYTQILHGNLRATVANGSTMPVADVIGEADVLLWGGHVGGFAASDPFGWAWIRFGSPSPPPILAAGYSGTWAVDTAKTVSVLHPGYYDPPDLRAYNPLRTISTNGPDATVGQISVACVNNRWQLISVPPKA